MRVPEIVARRNWPTSHGGPTLVVGVLLAAAAVLLVVLLNLALPVYAVMDLVGHRVLHGAPGSALTVAARIVTDAGSSPALYPIAVFGGWALSPHRGRGSWADALLVAALLGLCALLRTGVSQLVARPRPATSEWLVPATGWSFPSGHTTNTTIVVGLLVVLAHRGASGPRPLIWLGGVLAIAAVGLSRIYLGVHWPTDVLGGWAAGTVWVAALTLIGDRMPSPSAREHQ